MEFYLVKEEPIQFGPKIYHLANGAGRVMYPVDMTLAPVVTNSKTADDYCTAFKNLLFANGLVAKESWQGRRKKRIINPTLQVALICAVSSLSRVQTVVQFCNGGDTGNIAERLCQSFGSDHFRLNFTLTNFGTDENCENFWFKPKEIAVKIGSIPFMESIKNYRCKLPQVKLPDSLLPKWKEERSVFTGHLTVTVTLDEQAVAALYMDNRKPGNDLVKMNKSMLENETCTDLTLVATDGSKIQCHKAFLAASSPVFKAMFEFEMKQGNFRQARIPEMSEAGVRAMLAFIYHWDIKEASNSCSVALELFRAGHNYHISNLAQTMVELMCAKHNEWFSVDMAVGLFTCIRNLEGREEMKVEIQKKIIDVFCWHCDFAEESIQGSGEFQEMVGNNPKAAADLFVLIGKRETL